MEPGEDRRRLSIYLSRHNILSTYDGDYICWHVMFGHRIESL